MVPKIYHTSEHDIQSNFIDPDAIYIIEKLRLSGFQAYLVGGSVRDLLKGIKPKDFDIATSALPEEIKTVFRRNCLLIGRRFRLAHIRFGKKIFEVSTFRAGNIESNELIIHDNEWGTPEEDVLRRDFTMNGLFYDPTDRSVIDYSGGWEDIRNGVLRTIGNPHARFNQDPVRMIRLLKFQARFGFTIDPETLEALIQNKHTIIKSSQARILEEMLRMLESGYSEIFIKLLKNHNFLELLFPWLGQFLDSDEGEKIYLLLSQADQLQKKSFRPVVDRSVMIACLIFPILEKEIHEKYLAKEITPHLGEIADVTFSILRDIVDKSFSKFPRRLSTSAAGILIMQYRLDPHGKRRLRKHKIMNSTDFLEALSFLKLRAMKDPDVMKIYEFWQNSQNEQTTHE